MENNKKFKSISRKEKKKRARGNIEGKIMAHYNIFFDRFLFFLFISSLSLLFRRRNLSSNREIKEMRNKKNSGSSSSSSRSSSYTKHHQQHK